MSDIKTTICWAESAYNLLHDIAFATNRKPAEVLRDALVLEKVWMDAVRNGDILCIRSKGGRVKSDLVHRWEATP
jgi:hypothetical protein